MKTKQPLLRSRNKSRRPSAAQLASGLIISVGEARKLMGADAKRYSDDELIIMIYELSELAQTLLKATVSSVNKIL